jgi:D-amino-acid dehydrogenase
MKHILVIGAGIVGLASAYALTRAGYQVTVVDGASDAGQGASFANGAQLSYSYVEPLAGPSTLRSLPSLLLAPESPLKLRFQLDLQQWFWGLSFLRACTKKQNQAGTRSLLALAARSRDTLERWMAEEAWSEAELGFARNGKLVLCKTPESLAAQAAQLEFQAQLGSVQRLLSMPECIEREPSIAHLGNEYAGGVWTESECVIDTHALCQAYVKSLRARGASVSFNTVIEGFRITGNRVQAAVTQSGEEFAADGFVLAAGAASVQLAKQLGLRVPVYPIKGYSLSLPIKNPARAPTVSITDLKRKTVFAPLHSAGQSRLRVAAAAEIVGYGLQIPKARLEQMCRAAQALFPGACELSHESAWAGLRPSTPDSLPRTQATRYNNAFLNIGQGSLGLTLSAGSAVALVEVLKQQRSF